MIYLIIYDAYAYHLELGRFAKIVAMLLFASFLMLEDLLFEVRFLLVMMVIGLSGKVPPSNKSVCWV